MSRMDRYNENSSSNHASRIDRNKNLYQDFSMNAIYTNITDVTNANAYEIDTNPSNSYKTREAYQHLKEYQDIEIPKEQKELNDVNYLKERQENKIYDINSVLENARKNRTEQDELDEKRKLKNKAYNILSGKNREELERYREERKKRLLTPEEEELRELIDTIASKTLAGEIDKATSVDLLSDLMATNVLDKVDASGEIELTATHEITQVYDEVVDEKLSLSKKILETSEIKDLMLNGKEETEEVPVVEETEEKAQKIDAVKDPDFYTRSMDLSDKDFEFGEFADRKLPLVVKIIIIIVVLALIVACGYFIYQKMF